MPDPLLYLQGIAAAVCASAAVMGFISRRASLSSRRSSGAGLLSLAGGLLAGSLALRLIPRWPPVNGLDRFLAIVLPAALLIEWLTRRTGVPRWLALALRGGLAVGSGPVLLWGSVYLGGSQGAWSPVMAALILGASAATLVLARCLAEELFERSPGVTVPLLVAVCIQSAGLAVMLAGYLKGGAAAFPMAASLAAMALVSYWRGPEFASSIRASLAVAVVGLYGIVFIGRLFGGLSTWSALVLLMAPAAPWLVEALPLRSSRPRLAAGLQVLSTVSALALVLVPAAIDFVQRSLPLL